MTDWKLKDIKIVCYNLQNKITPFAASESELCKRATKICKEYKCDEYTAYVLLKRHLARELEEKRQAENASLCKNLRQND